MKYRTNHKCHPFLYAGLTKEGKRSVKENVKPSIEQMDIIARACCYEMDVTMDDFKSPIRDREVVDARKMFYYLCREDLYYFTCRVIGEYTGGRDHSTVVYGVKRAEELLQIDKQFRLSFTAARQRARQILKLNGHEFHWKHAQ